jgi:hypothetical protein
MTRIFRRRGPFAAGSVAAATVGTAVAAFALGASGARPQTGPLVVRASAKPPAGRFVRADGLYDGEGGRAQLDSAVSGAMMGPLSPVAVASPDGSVVAYNTWRAARSVDGSRSFSSQGIQNGDDLGVPSLRIHANAGHDLLLARGAYSAAWRRDGAIAFVSGSDPTFRAGQVYDGEVVVRTGIHGRDVTWTSEPAHYIVYAWAGDRLLFYRLGLGEKLELLVADGPARIRPLADGSAIAVSPDGTRVAVVSQDGTNVRVLDVASGRELGWLDVTTTSPPLRWVAYSGSWVGDHIVAPASSGLAVFHAADGSLTLEQALSLDQAQFPAGVQEPRFADADANDITAVADVPPRNGDGGVSVFLDCDRITRTCDRGPSAPANDWLRAVDPEGGR